MAVNFRGLPDFNSLYSPLPPWMQGSQAGRMMLASTGPGSAPAPVPAPALATAPVPAPPPATAPAPPATTAPLLTMAPPPVALGGAPFLTPATRTPPPPATAPATPLPGAPGGPAYGFDEGQRAGPGQAPRGTPAPASPATDPRLTTAPLPPRRPPDLGSLFSPGQGSGSGMTAMMAARDRLDGSRDYR
jgi:hypothetical protein